MAAETILCKPRSQLLADVGCALLQIKNARGLTSDDLAAELGVTRQMLAQYINGEAEMGFLKWLRANECFPELRERIEETAAERAVRARQHVLDLELPSARKSLADYLAQGMA